VVDRKARYDQISPDMQETRSRTRPIANTNIITETGSEPQKFKLAIPWWVDLQYLCYHNTFVSAIVHNTFATIPLSTIPYTGIP
jgi:hypothetical protein